MEGHWKFLGAGGLLKAKFLEEMYENKLEFPGGRGEGGGGYKIENLPWGEYTMWIFCGTAQCELRQIHAIDFASEVSLIQELKLSNPKKSFDHPHHFKSGVPPPPPLLGYFY